MIRIFAAAMFLSTCGVYAQDNNTIVIRGHRSEKRALHGPARGFDVRAEDASRQGLDTHFKDQASLQSVRTGEVKASSFNIPSIRGQDTRVSDVYVNDILLSNPYTGYNLLDQLDLRAFDSMTLYQGLAAEDLASANPIGNVQLKLLPIHQPSFAFGADVGKPYGHSEWVLIKDRRAEDMGAVFARTYLRKHRSSGEYSFYSDEGTPFETSDDKIRTRKDNQTESINVIQSLSYYSESVQLDALFIRDEGERGIPSFAGLTRTHATRSHVNDLYHLKAQKFFEKSFVRNVALAATKNFSHVSNADPLALIDPMRTQSHFYLESNQYVARSNFGTESTELLLEAQHSHAEFETSMERARRKEDKYYLGLSQDIASIADALVKVVSIQREDKSPSWSRKAKHWDHAFGLSSEEFAGLGVYAQYGRYHRPSAAIEVLGDGAGVLANPDLSDESLLHREIGVTWKQSKSFGLGYSYFIDLTENKIIILPSSLPNAWRAQNVQNTAMKGHEVNLDWKLLPGPSLRASYLYLNALNKTPGERDKKIPGFAKHNIAAELAQSLAIFTFRWASRYRSETYRDTRNSVEYAPLTLHDASIDMRIREGEKDFRVGILLSNVLDQKFNSISANESGEHGRTAISEVRGYPMPGRSLQISALASF